MSDLLIRDCHVIQCEETEVRILAHHDIHIRSGLIHAIVPSGSLPAPTAEVLEGRGMVAMPGLIDTHAHVPMVIFRGLAEDVNLETWFNEYMWPLESNLQEQDVANGMALGLVELIEGGVTTVADQDFSLHSIPATLVYATRASDVQSVVVGGRVIMRDRELLTLDKASIIGDVHESMQRLSRRVPEARIQAYRP